ncbi:hypothetical protein [Ureibacillus acetophenoni]|uniref:Copper resistance protein D domain-containing protein n=1 Tax=Ureibacillus acetophenoni TaxID=614649 RepID=A0A285UI11_9BACL|nr:hypothetical protein [Ureibacillus acetophenoni]SOC41499.1 hypothetical protein SAMN05877842_110110 [Ureibacillus acetophenoni]
MYSLYYILHIVGIAVWIGSFLVLGYLLKTLAKEQRRLIDLSPVIKKIQKWVMVGVVPSLVLILVSGSFMIFEFNRDSMPLYLKLMEQGGTLIILLTIIFVSIYSVKITKKLQGIQLKKDKSLAQLTKIYANYLLISTLFGIGVVIVVGLRLV